MDAERDFKGIWIPREIWLDPKLTMFQRMLLAEIDSLDCGDGCFMSDKKLAKRMDCSLSHLMNSITKLRKEGFINTIKRGLRKRYLRTSFSRHLVNKTPTRESRSNLLEKVDSSLSTIKSRKQYRCDAGASRGSLGVLNGESFTGKVTQRFLKWAAKKRLLLGRPDPNIAALYKAVNELMARLDNDKARFTKVMRWYFDHFRDEYVPQCYTLKTFCEKFAQVEAARVRWIKSNPGQAGHWEETEIWLPKRNGRGSYKRTVSSWVEDET